MHFARRWPRLQRFYRQNECCDWLREYKTRHRVGIQIQRTVESISKRFFTEVVSIRFVADFAKDTFFKLVLHVWQNEMKQSQLSATRCDSSMLQTNPEVCNSALRWPGAGGQLCRDRGPRDARALLRRRASLHTQL